MRTRTTFGIMILAFVLTFLGSTAMSQSFVDMRASRWISLHLGLIVCLGLPSYGADYANLPYLTGFESGLDQYWTTTNSYWNGRTVVTDSYEPHSGTKHLIMDVTYNGILCRNEAWLHLNMATVGGAELNFWWKNYSDSSTQNGVYLSDNGGASFNKVYDLNGYSSSDPDWINITLDIASLALEGGLDLTDSFVVKFQHRDNYAIPVDGFAFDDISVQPYAIDLFVENPSPDPAVVGPETQMSVSCALRNQGDRASERSYLKYYLSSNTTYEVSDRFLSLQSVSVPANGEVPLIDSFWVPDDTAFGTWYILFVADADNVVPEVNEANNLGYAQITVAPADLTVTDITVSPSVLAANGDTLLTCTVRNAGAGGCPSTFLDCYFSSNAIYDAADTDLGTIFVDAMAAGGSVCISNTVRVPSRTEPGTSHVLFVADAFDRVTERDENNNIAGHSLSVIAPDVDLVVQNADVEPDSLTYGDDFTVSCDVKNQGLTHAESSVLWYYLSQDTVLDGADRSLLRGPNVDRIPGGGVSPETTDLVIPRDISPGTWYVLFVADDFERVDETDEENNVTPVQLTITEPDRDIKVRNTGVDPSTILAGGHADASCEVWNDGGSSANVSTLKYYLSRDTVYDDSDTDLYEEDGVASLAGGASSAESESLWIRNGTWGGTWYVLFVADINDDVVEAHEDNNVGYHQITVTVPPVDLIVQSADVTPATVEAGLNASVSYVVKNQGTAEAAYSVVTYRLSDDTTYDSSDAFLGSDSLGNLSAGGTSSEDALLPIPETIAPGTWYILFRADGFDYVSETDEMNNVAARQITVIPPDRDLTVLNPHVDAGAVPAGQSLEVVCIVTNSGTRTAAYSYLKYYLSTDDTFHTNDIYLTSNYVPSLPAGGASSESRSVAIPGDTQPGMWFLLLFADHGDRVIECNESNNVAQVAVEILPADADSDGIPDAWELHYFENLTVCNETSDWDGDGFLDCHERLAGTNPTNPASLLQCTRLEQQSFDTLLLRWSSISGKMYAVCVSPDLDTPFQIERSNILARPPENTYTGVVDSAPQRFYRIKLEHED